jgi:small subunit ribosomal protein S1
VSDKESFAALFAESSRPARRFAVGDKLDVTVTKVGKVAVFVSLDENTEGYLDAPDLADKHGKIEVEPGTRIHARVAEIGGRSGAVRLTPVAIRGEHDEVQAVTGGARSEETTLVVGFKIKVSVQKVEKFGIFVNIAGSKKRALLRAQDTGTPRGADLTKHFPPGKELDVKIINISDDGKIGVSITALALDEERENFTNLGKEGEGGEGAAAGAKPGKGGGKGGGGNGPLKPGMDGKAPKSLGTLGDLLSKVKVKKLAARRAVSAARPVAARQQKARVRRLRAGFCFVHAPVRAVGRSRQDA